MTNSNSAAALMRRQFAFATNWFEGTMGDITSEQAHWQPQGRAMPAAADYAHVITTLDALVAGLLMGKPPLLATIFVGKTGLSEMPPPSPPWDAWGRRVKLDLPAAREYAKAVYAQLDSHLASIGDDDLAKPLDLSMVGMGMQNAEFLLGLLLLNLYAHSGEISAVKGLQGLQGYPA